MKKRGFTLVELLAVIVILAIIALIAVPVFLGIINNSKKSSDKEGVNLYTDTVEKAIQKKQMSDPNFMPDKCDIQRDGNLECFNGTTSLGTVKVSMKGTKPSSGTIYITEDDITYENIVLNGKTYYKKASNATLVNDASPTGISIGDKYTYKVNDTDTFNFYVLSIDGDKVNLIMDRNICEDGTQATETNTCLVAWHSKIEEYEYYNNYGPNTAMTYLYNGTKDWNNVPDMIMNYADEYNSGEAENGYTNIITSNGITTITGKNGATNTTIGTSAKPLKARLPRKDEVTSTDTKCANSSGSCSMWLVENLADGNINNYSAISKINNIYGYWLLASSPGNTWNASCIIFDGVIGAAAGASSEIDNGVRPVITVPLSDLN